MRFVLQEYLSSLKEDGELDAFCTELLKSMRLIPLTKIQRGRQYGVDLPAVGKDEDGIKKLFLLVIKQGNLSRQTWEGGSINDVKPSIGEILDVYLNTSIPPQFKSLPIKIVVCFNGELEQAVQINWSQFVNKHTNERVEIVYWNIHTLIDYSLKYQLPEELLPYDLALNFRKALAFIDIPDYNLSHLYRFIQNLLPENESKLKDRQVYRKMRIVNLCVSIIHKWCKESNNLKPSFIAIERIILNTYKWILDNNFFERKDTLQIFSSILLSWRHHNYEYLKNIGDFVLVPDGLSLGVPNHDEYCLITFEQIGIISMIGQYELWECSINMLHPKDEVFKNAQTAFKNAEFAANMLAKLIKNNPSAINPKFDEHCIEINIALTLFYELGYFAVAIDWLRRLVDRVALQVKMKNFLPLFITDPEKLSVEKAEDQPSSHLLYFLAEWCLILHELDCYYLLRELVLNDLPKLNLQLWLPDKKVEEFLFTENASFKGGATMTSLSLPKNYIMLKMHIAEERALINEEKNFHYNQNHLLFMPFLASRHFRTYPFPNSWRKYLQTPFCFNN